MKPLECVKHDGTWFTPRADHWQCYDYLNSADPAIDAIDLAEIDGNCHVETMTVAVVVAYHPDGLFVNHAMVLPRTFSVPIEPDMKTPGGQSGESEIDVQAVLSGVYVVADEPLRYVYLYDLSDPDDLLSDYTDSDHGRAARRLFDDMAKARGGDV